MFFNEQKTKQKQIIILIVLSKSLLIKHILYIFFSFLIYKNVFGLQGRIEKFLSQSVGEEYGEKRLL